MLFSIECYYAKDTVIYCQLVYVYSSKIILDYKF